MQNNEKLHEIQSTFAKKIAPLQQLGRQVRVANFGHELRDKTFSERNEPLFFLAIALSFLSQCLSAWASYMAVHSVVAMKASGDVAIAVSIVLLVAIEVVKYALVTITFGQIFSLRPAYPHAIICIMLLWSGFSMYLAVSGSTEIAKDKTTENRLKQEQTAKEKELKNTIAEIQNTDTYKDVIWSGGGVSSKVLSNVGKGLIQKRELELDSLRKTYKTKTNDFQNAQSAAQSKFNYFFGIFEALFLIATAYTFYYKRLLSLSNTAQTKP